MDRSVFKPEEMPWKGKCKPNSYSEKWRKQAFQRDLHERAAEPYPELRLNLVSREGMTSPNK